jgi:RNA polymerase sigma factor (sigma-70 family)
MDIKVFDELYKHHTKFVLYARKFTRNECDAEDAVQQAYYRMLRAAKNNDGVNPSAYLYVTIRSVCITMHRQKKPECSIEDIIPDELPATEEHIPDDTLTAMHSVLKGMPRIQREIIYELANDEPLAEIARKKSLPIGTIMSRSYRAREHAKERLAQYLRVS